MVHSIGLLSLAIQIPNENQAVSILIVQLNHGDGYEFTMSGGFAPYPVSNYVFPVRKILIPVL